MVLLDNVLMLKILQHLNNVWMPSLGCKVYRCPLQVSQKVDVSTCRNEQTSDVSIAEPDGEV